MLKLLEGVVMVMESGETVLTPQAGEQLIAEVATWLQEQTQPALPVYWRFRGGGRIEVRGLAHLAQLVYGVHAVADWAVVERPGGWPWAQTMRVDGGWVTEVDGAALPDPFAQRVMRAGFFTSGSPLAILRCRDAEGLAGTTYMIPEVMATPAENARLLWSWVHGRLPGGYELRYLGDWY